MVYLNKFKRNTRQNLKRKKTPNPLPCMQFDAISLGIHVDMRHNANSDEPKTSEDERKKERRISRQ